MAPALVARVARAAPSPSAASEPVDEQSEFEKGRNAYRAKQFEEADVRFLRMLDPEHGTLHDKVLIKQARMYRAAALVAEHQEGDAALLFETILNQDPDYEPDPLAFPTEVVNAFIDTRARLREKLAEMQRELYRRAAERRAHEDEARKREAARIKTLEKLAGEVEVTERHSRWRAILPFGVGQFQNGQRTLGWFFLGTEAALVAGGVATVPVYYVELADAHSTYTSQTRAIAQQYLDRAYAVEVLNNALYGVLAATVIAGAIQAEVAFVPDPVITKPRIVPGVTTPLEPTSAAPPPLTFGASPLSGRDGRSFAGAQLSVGGTF
jgi:hypothetical protein